MVSNYRNEHKFVLSPSEYEILKQKIKQVLDVDKHAIEDNYHVRSLYFENIHNSSFHDKEAGIYKRSKFRLRMYNHDPSFLKFEKKKKDGDLISKEFFSVSKIDSEKIIKGDFSPLIHLKQYKIYTELQMLYYKPSVIIDYIREPYVYSAGNVRVTFDLHIFSRHNTLDFFNKLTPGIPVLPSNQIVMEIKYGSWLPFWLKQLLQNQINSRRSVSKYCLGFQNIPIRG